MNSFENMTTDDFSAIRFKQLREELSYTQAEFARLLHINSHSTADIERGKTRLSGQAVMELLHQFNINPLWIYGRSEQKYQTPLKTDVAPAVVTVDPDGNENIIFVDAKAAAGYPENIQNPSWYDRQPAFSIPLPEFRNASFRGFQVEGDSMMNMLRPNEWVIGRAIGELDEMEDGQVYVVISKSSVLVKKVKRSKGRLQLISENPAYPEQHMLYGDVQEMWKVTSKLSFELDSGQSRLQDIEKELKEIRQKLEHTSGNLS